MAVPVALAVAAVVTAAVAGVVVVETGVGAPAAVGLQSCRRC